MGIIFCAGTDFEEISVISCQTHDMARQTFLQHFSMNMVFRMVLQTSCRLALLHRLLKSTLNATNAKKTPTTIEWTAEYKKHQQSHYKRKSNSLNEYLSVLSILAPICVIFHNIHASAYLPRIRIHFSGRKTWLYANNRWSIWMHFTFLCRSF